MKLIILFIIYGFLRNGIFDITTYDITYFFYLYCFVPKLILTLVIWVTKVLNYFFAMLIVYKGGTLKMNQF
jgi:hypothetical protein